MSSVVVLVTDLMDRSRIAAAVDDPVFVRDVHGLAAASPSVAIVDLRLVADPLEARRAVPHARLVGFGSHVDDETFDAARRAGFDEVVSRSAFFRSISRFVG